MTQQQPGVGTVRLHIQGSQLLRLVFPSVTVNGQPVPVRYGVNDLPVYAGPVHLHCETSWLRTYGQADLQLDLAPGGFAEVWYAAPNHQFTTGSIGYQKQTPKGTVAMVALVGVALLVAVLLISL